MGQVQSELGPSALVWRYKCGNGHHGPQQQCQARTPGCPFAMVSMCYVTAQHCPVSQPTTVLEQWQLVLSPRLGSHHLCHGCQSAASWEGWGQLWGLRGMVGTKTTLAAPPATPWDCHDTVGTGTGEVTCACPVLGVGFSHKNRVYTESQGHSSQQSPVVTHTHTETYTDTHTHTVLFSQVGQQLDAQSCVSRTVYPEPRP